MDRCMHLDRQITHAWMDGWMDRQAHGWMDEQTNKQEDKRMDGCKQTDTQPLNG